MITTLPCRAVLGLCLALLPFFCSAADDWLGLADGKAQLVDEPVFGGKAWVYEAGLGHSETVVLVHGLGNGGADDWKPLIPALARNYHVLTFDLPGFGRSDQGNYLYTPSTYARFLDFLVGRFVKGDFHLAGHSMGGAIAARYAASLPERVRTLTLIDAAGILQRVAFQKSLAVGAVEENIPPIFETQDADTRDLIAWLVDLGESFGIGPDLVLNTPPLRQSILKGDPLRIAGLGLVMENFSDLAWSLKMPVLLVWGDRDSVAPIRTGKVLDEVLPHADLQVLRGTGHNPMLQSPKALLKVLQDFYAGSLSVDDTPAIGKVSTAKGTAPLDCNGQANVEITSGSYSEITVDGCRRLVLKNLRAGRITIRDAEVEMENVIVDGGDIAMDIDNSVVIITNGRITGDVVFKAESSRVDVAGTQLVAGKNLVKSLLPSSFIFSIVPAESPGQRRYLHEYVRTSLIKSL